MGSSALGQGIDNLIATLEQVVDNIATVEVRTYVSGSAGRELRAITQVNIGGDTSHCLPSKPDATLCKIHLAMVDRAVANRVEMLRLAAGAIGGPVPESNPK